MFINYWAVFAGLMAAGLPVLVHWMTKPRPTRLPVSTLRFIRNAVHQRRTYFRIRDLLVLLLRCAAILLIALAIARPSFLQEARPDETTDADISRVVLLDCSQSMSASEGGIDRFTRARPVVANYLKYRPDMKCNLLLAAASPNAVFRDLASNLGALRDALSNATVRSERLRVQMSINLAAELLAKANPESTNELIIVSDFQRSNWASVDFSVLPANCDVQLKSVVSRPKLANIALLDVSATERVQAGGEANFAVRIGNFSNAARHVRLELRLGKVVVPLEGYCPSQRETVLAGRIPVSSPGWLTGSAKLLSAEDAMSEDDALPISLEVHAAQRVAILTRDPPRRTATSAYFIEQALKSTVSSRDADEELVFRVDAADPQFERLRLADVIVIARPGPLSPDAIAVIASMVQRGRGVLYVANDQLDVGNLRAITEAIGNSLRMPVDYFPRTGTRGGAKRFLTDVDQRRSPFSIFGDELSAAVSSLEFMGGLMTRPSSGGLADDIRAKFNDQSSFLVVSSAGGGKFAVLNVDLERSTLPKTPVLVPLLGELISQDLASRRQPQNTFNSGEPFLLKLPIGEENLEEISIAETDVKIPDESVGRFLAMPGGVVWDVPRGGPVDAYEVKHKSKTVATAITRIPIEESNLQSLSEKVFQERLAGGRDLEFSTTMTNSTETQDSTWVWLAMGCVGCLVLEMLTLKFFRT